MGLSFSLSLFLSLSLCLLLLFFGRGSRTVGSDYLRIPCKNHKRSSDFSMLGCSSTIIYHYLPLSTIIYPFMVAGGYLAPIYQPSLLLAM
jgi:hypothetical protein